MVLLCPNLTWHAISNHGRFNLTYFIKYKFVLLTLSIIMTKNQLMTLKRKNLMAQLYIENRKNPNQLWS